MEIKDCPCGASPDRLCVSGPSMRSKWAIVTCSVCGEWELEFRTQYHELDSAECMLLAIDAWNAAPRGGMK